MKQYRFLEVFPFCAELADLCGGLDAATLSAVEVDREKLALRADAYFARMPAPAELETLERMIAAEYGLNSARIAPDFPEAKAAAPGKSASGAQIILGRGAKGEPTDIGALTLDSGNVTVRGRVFGTDSREIPKARAVVLSFCLTDGTGSIHVSKFIRENDEGKAAVGRISDGMYLSVSGNVGYNRYDDDITLEPRGIQTAPEPPTRDDTAKEKRVELHLHTRFSNLDALTDPAAVIKRAAKWGHRAIAITDHGVAQAFPKAWEAAGKAKIKIIYGMEGYYINDIDEKLAITGESELPLDSEFVAFDIETTGLDAMHDRITEIGAAVFRGGEIGETFNTFANPEMPIPPEITRLTGITDADVADAPGEAEAVRAFLDFAGGRPIIAHNADFDVGFIDQAAKRNGIEFNPVYLDTLVLAQTLLPHLKRHKLDIVSSFLGLPDFNHHRASDDAMVVARMMDKFIPMLRERGVEFLCDLEPAMQEARRESVRSQKAKHIVLLVKNKVGLKNLYQLISKSHLEHFKRNPIIPKSLLMEHREGLIVGSACASGEIFEAMLRRGSDAQLKRLASFYDYIEIQPICNNRFLLDNGTARNPEDLREYNRRLARLAHELGKPLVATGDVHFLDPEDEIYRHILLDSRNFDDADKPLPIYFKTTDEMLEEFSYLGEQECYDAVIANPNRIADMCEEIQLFPKGQLFAPKIENSAEDLRNLVFSRMTELYGENPPEIVSERVKIELDTILEHEYDVIYMSAQKLVQDALEHGSLVGSRGSVGSSLVAYMAGITEVNALPAHYRCPECRYTDFESGKEYGCGVDMPDKTCPVCGAKLVKDGFGIPFETFLGFPGNAKTPDIDLNFSGEYQARAHKYTETLFGADHIFRAGTIGTLKEKTAYGYVKKYLEKREMTVTKAEETRLCLGCDGVKRTSGQHPGGIIVVPQDKDITDFCPVQHPADDPNSSIITTHFDYHCMEDNLLKLDELGHDNPTMMKMLKEMTGIDAQDIPLDDRETMESFRSPKPLGLPDDDPVIGKTGSLSIPEFGTGFTRQMLVDTQPDGFDILVRICGYAHGQEVWLGNAKDLIDSGTATLNETVGCRDDIMIYLIKMGMEPKMAFKIMEKVRKGKVKKGGFEEGWVEKMQELGVPQWYIDSLAKISYLFPRAHAVAYVTEAFRLAWYKVHHPLAYYSAYFYRRSQKGAFDAGCMTQGLDTVRKKMNSIRQNPKPTAKEEDLFTTLELVYEFYMRGFSFAPIDLYESDASKFLPVGEKQLRPPFMAISGLGETAANNLGACRERGESFISIEDLKAACPKVSQAHIQQLRELGALGGLPETSQMSLF